MVYVGDKFQQIYEWRGAVNAMEAVRTEASTHLTMSFRFGGEIAEAATALLRRMGETRPLIGNPTRPSRITGTPNAGTVLSRTNSSTISIVIEALDAGRRPYLVGGTADLMTMLRGVADLKQGQPSTVPEFFGFTQWTDVVEFARSDEGSHLQTFVNLVQERGERRLMWALRRATNEEGADLIVSTAHRAKGREWSAVRLTDDFLKSAPKPTKVKLDDGESSADEFSELRLLYVAITRARDAIEVPPPLLSQLGLNSNEARHITTDPSSTEAAPQTLRSPLPQRVPSPPSPRQGELSLNQVQPLKAELSPSNVSPSSIPPPFSAPEPSPPSSTSWTPAPTAPEPEPAKRKGLLSWLLGR